MVPEEITTLVDNMLPEIAQKAEKGSGYYFYQGSGLSAEHWDALKTRLLEDALITDAKVRAIALTPEGQRIATEGIGAYRRFLIAKQTRAEDPFRTNRFTRWGVIFSGFALLVSVIAIWVSWLAYKKPDDNAAAIQKLRDIRLADSVNLTRLSVRLDSLAHRSAAANLTAPAKPLPAPTDSKKQVHASTPPPAQVPTGRRAPAQ